MSLVFFEFDAKEVLPYVSSSPYDNGHQAAHDVNDENGHGNHHQSSPPPAPFNHHYNQKHYTPSPHAQYHHPHNNPHHNPHHYPNNNHEKHHAMSKHHQMHGNVHHPHHVYSSDVTMNMFSKSPAFASIVPGFPLANIESLSALQNNFNGVTYSAYRPGRCPGSAEVQSDIETIIKHANKVRTYTVECEEMIRALLEHASQGTLSVIIGVWVGDNRQLGEIETLINLLREFPNAKINGIAVGNEALYDHRVFEHELVHLINLTREKVRGLAAELGSQSLATVPVFTVEATTSLSAAAIEASDCVGVNIHPFYDRHLDSKSDPDSFHIGQKALLSFIKNYKYIKKTYGKRVIVTEVGWPTLSESTEYNYGSFQISSNFMKGFMNYVRNKPIEYYWFELFDAKWKKTIMHVPDNNSEFYWGIYKEDYMTCKPFFNE